MYFIPFVISLSAYLLRSEGSSGGCVRLHVCYRKWPVRLQPTETGSGTSLRTSYSDSDGDAARGESGVRSTCRHQADPGRCLCLGASSIPTAARLCRIESAASQSTASESRLPEHSASSETHRIAFVAPLSPQASGQTAVKMDKILDFSQELDVSTLDQVVQVMYTSSGAQVGASSASIPSCRD